MSGFHPCPMAMMICFWWFQIKDIWEDVLTAATVSVQYLTRFKNLAAGCLNCYEYGRQGTRKVYGWALDTLSVMFMDSLILFWAKTISWRGTRQSDLLGTLGTMEGPTGAVITGSARTIRPTESRYDGSCQNDLRLCLPRYTYCARPSINATHLILTE